MIPLYRLAEVAAYALLNFVPFLLLALYPFRERLRFSRGVTGALVGALTAVQLGLGVGAAFFSGGHPGLISAVSTALYAAFYFAAVKAPVGKTLFVLLMLSNNANFAVVAAKCIEGQLFPALAVQPYRWSFSLLLFLVECAVLVPLFLYFKRFFVPAVDKEPSGVEWRYLWLIPATFYLLWYYGIYGNISRSSLEIALRPGNAIFFLFINLGAFVVYHVISMLVLEQTRNLALRESNHRLAMQTLQYERLQERIAAARRARHDLRHHVVLMREYLREGRCDKLEEYLGEYQETLPDEDAPRFCENETVNTILLYYAQRAKQGGVAFDAQLRIPAQLGLARTELSVLLGNLLENALDACAAERGEGRRIVLRADADASSLCLTVDNSFSGALSRNPDGSIPSSKHPGEGLGLSSVRVIAERHRGVLRLEQREGMFCASVLLNLDEETPAAAD